MDRNMWLCMCIMMSSIILSTATGASDNSDVKAWQPIGDAKRVMWDGSKLQVNGGDAATAGVVSDAISLPSGADSVMISAEAGATFTRGVTFSVHDAATGNPLGYWQNPIKIKSPAEACAIMTLAGPTESVRCFIGSDRSPETVSLTDIHVKPLRKAIVISRRVDYGAAVTKSTSLYQTFTATGKQLGGIRFKARQRTENQLDGGLRVSVYEWAGTPAASLQGPALAEAMVAPTMLPVKSVHEEIPVSVYLPAATEPGKTYVIEFALAAEAKEEQGCVIWGGPDSYEGGTLYKNQQDSKWDLLMEVFDASW